MIKLLIIENITYKNSVYIFDRGFMPKLVYAHTKRVKDAKLESKKP